MRALRIVISVSTVAVVALSGCAGAPDSVQANPSGSSQTPFNAESVTRDPALVELIPAALRSRGSLVVGSDTSYAPAEFLGGADGQTPMGYDVDFAKAIGATLGLKVQYESASFASILPALGAKYDLGISAFSITQERLDAVHLVSYYKNGSIFAVQKGNPKGVDIQRLCGKSIAVQTGSTQESDVQARAAKCLSAGSPPIQVVSLKNQTDVTTRLVTGGVDAMVSGAGTVSYAISQTRDQLQLLGDLYSPRLVGIAVAKDDLPLANLVEKVMNKLISDGTYARILSSWDMNVLAIDKSVVNPHVAQ
jgi:polar amino acid transport system substrate-binding protein